ncbi:protein RRNAD1 isoform X3 [Micropterus salmoides]|uniref:protein RRNAD1 isoform X3 n=1 Tax=Micropterus salmoides TaxID=27706 RepID=UPI0018EAE5A6|nr:protein RRNAD1 isoform X3 [Micropterus salmoides]
MSVNLSPDVEMFTSSLSAEQARELAKRLTTFLSQYSHLSDSYIIEFFTEDLWHTLPNSWQPVLQGLSYPQIADLLLDATHGDRRYPSVWPLSLLAFRATAHALAFPRECRRERGRAAGSVKPEEFLENQSQSSLLGHIFRKHVKPKKQHEIRKLGTLVKQICDQTDCNRVVDVGSGQSGSYPVPVSQSSPRHVAGWLNPKASWETFIKQLSTADCDSKVPPTPSGPSKKRLRGCELQGCSPVVQTSSSRGSTDSGLRSQHNNESEEESSAENCCSCVQPVRQEDARPEENSRCRYPDFVLTGLHACGDLSATLLRHFVKCPHVRGITSVACCYMKITTKENPTPPGLVECPAPPTPGQELVSSEFGYPMSSWVRGLPGHQLSYKAREGSCHAIEDYIRRLREESELLRTHCYRATLETFIRDTRPDLRRAGIQTIKKAHLLPFTEYARLGLARVGLPPELPLDPERVEAMLKLQGRVVVYFSLALLLAPVVETLVLLDRIIYLQENGVVSRLIPLFDPNFSPRNFVLVALKARGSPKSNYTSRSSLGKVTPIFGE